MKILLTGSSGMLGSALEKEASIAGHICHPLKRDVVWKGSTRDLANILFSYDILIHAAANTNVELCETNIDACYRDNYLMTERIAQAARMANIKLVFISSTGIYGTSKTVPYCEFDVPLPTTHHHQSKYLAEQATMSMDTDNLVVRTGWLFGGSIENPKNFVAGRLKDAKAALAAGDVMLSDQSQWGVPCYSKDISQRILNLAELGYAGIFNCVNQGRARRYDYVQAIISAAKLPVRLRPAASFGLKRKAKVSENEMADNWKMHQLGLAPMPDWEQSLLEYVNRIYKLRNEIGSRGTD